MKINRALHLKLRHKKQGRKIPTALLRLAVVIVGEGTKEKDVLGKDGKESCLC